MDYRTGMKAKWLAWLFAAGMVVPMAVTQAAQGKADHPSAGPVAAQPGQTGSPYHAVSISRHAKGYYMSVWGIDNMLVHRTESNNLVRFSYRVTDPVRAKALGDKRTEPYMIDQRTRAVLHIPVMDKVGALRQTTAPVAGKEYSMLFSNKGFQVQAGDRVNVVIGSFRVDGLLVE